MGRKKAALTGQLADIDFRLLRVFKTVVEAGGISAAEVELNLANSTISNHLADLERRIDMRLCERGRAGFSVTEQGRVVYDATLTLLASVEQFRATINSTHHRLLGNLHLGVAEHMLGANPQCIPRAIDLFARAAPDVRIQISTMGSEEIISSLLSQTIDIGITVLTQPISEVQQFPLFSEKMHLYAANEHPLLSAPEPPNAKTVAQFSVVESPRLLPGREMHPDMRQWKKHAKAHHQEARAALIMSGHYLGFLPAHLVAGWGLQDRLSTVLADKYSYQNDIEAVWRKQHKNRTINELFIDCLRQAREQTQT
ncbi:MAG: LysR family transcriptional regulator [Pontibacterium sp.]